MQCSAVAAQLRAARRHPAQQISARLHTQLTRNLAARAGFSPRLSPPPPTLRVTAAAVATRLNCAANVNKPSRPVRLQLYHKIYAQSSRSLSFCVCLCGAPSLLCKHHPSRKHNTTRATLSLSLSLSIEKNLQEPPNIIIINTRSESNLGACR